jgi:hypothetical protein
MVIRTKKRLIERGAGLSAEVGEVDAEGSTTVAVLDTVEGSTTMVVLDEVESRNIVAMLDGMEGMTTYGTGSTRTKSTIKHKKGSILSKSSMCELNLTHLRIDL